MPWLALALLVAAAILRLARLSWQPLWWDEGYSIYFATEPLGRMLWLTAHDIHPPLYYALLHFWTSAAGDGPESTRLLSVLIGVLAVGVLWWLARVLYPESSRIAWVSALLLAVSPFHIYYSQEVRMYGLAMVLGMASTGFLWRLVVEERTSRRSWIAYVIATTAALYALYYMALLLLAQVVWALTVRDVRVRCWRRLLAAWAAIFLLFLPWLLYAAPLLVGYVGQKVASDQDQPLGAVAYLVQHVRAILVGHVLPASPWITWGLIGAVVGVGLIAAGVLRNRRSAHKNEGATFNRAIFLGIVTGVSIACAFLLNLRLPFFPEGGERLLLFVLPYAILLIACGVDRAGAIGAAGLALLLIASIIGTWTYYTTPRYATEDYRPVIRRIAAQSKPGDTLLALFPWMVGYWRAYAPDGVGDVRVRLPGDAALTWGPEMETEVDEALREQPGATLWLPEPLGIGSDLPGQVETWLRQHAINLANEWFSATTRLSAWTPQPLAEPSAQQNLVWQGQHFIFGPVTLTGSATISPTVVEAANAALPVGLAWQPNGDVDGLAVSLRMVDPNGRIWAEREYAPLGEFSDGTEDGVITETVAMLIPAGTPPGDYSLTLAVADRASGVPIPAVGPDNQSDLQAALGGLRVNAPSQPPDIARIEMTPARKSRISDGLTWLGWSVPGSPAQAGTTLEMEWVGQSLVETPPPRELYANLADGSGNVVAAWQGWPLDWYPTTGWSTNLATRVPVKVDLPAGVTSGVYHVTGGWFDPASGERSPETDFGTIEVWSRPFVAEQPIFATAVDPAVQFGTHARLIGYTLTRDGAHVALDLVWEVLETLLPAHHLFIHADDANQVTVAQADGPPLTADGPAPTGSWRPGEFITTHHVIEDVGDAQTLHVGLYDPDTLVRLPASIGGTAAGDAFAIPLGGE